MPAMHPHALETPRASLHDPLDEAGPTSGWGDFDHLHLVRPGRVLLVDVAARAGHSLFFDLLAGAVAEARDALVVDGGNWLDVYRLGDAAQARGLPRDAVLAGVQVARGFTAHQLQSLVEDALGERLADAAPPSLVLVSDLPDMYLDEDLAPAEARALLQRALATLRRLAATHRVPIVVTNGTLSPRHQHPLRQELEAGVDARVGLLPAPRDALRLVLPGVTLLMPSPRARQRQLDEYGDRLRAATGVPEGAFVKRNVHPMLKYAPKHAGELRFKQRMQSEALAGGA